MIDVKFVGGRHRLAAKGALTLVAHALHDAVAAEDVLAGQLVWPDHYIAADGAVDRHLILTFRGFIIL